MNCVTVMTHFLIDLLETPMSICLVSVTACESQKTNSKVVKITDTDY